MLKQMRRHAKYFYVLFFIVILSFIFWGVGTVDQNDPREIVAEVGDSKVTAQEYWQAYDRISKFYRELYKEKFDEAMQNKLKLKENVLSTLIENKVLLAAAKENGVSVTDAELGEAIQNESMFMKDGVFDSSVYENRLRLSRLTPDSYEAAKRQELIAEKMRRLIEIAANVPDLPAGMPSDEASAKTLKDALSQNEKAKAVKSYVAGLEKQMKVKIYSDRIS